MLKKGHGLICPLILGIIGYSSKDILSKNESQEVLEKHLPEIEALINTISLDEIDRLKKERLQRRLPGIQKE